MLLVFEIVPVISQIESIRGGRAGKAGKYVSVLLIQVFLAHHHVFLDIF